MCNRLHVSCGVLIFDRIAGVDHLLYGRKLKHPTGSVGTEFPGGKHDLGETIEESAKREVLEETGLVICEPRFLTYVQHANYMCMMFAAIPVGGDLELREPHKHMWWRWYPVDQPPNNLIDYCYDALINIGHMYHEETCFHITVMCPTCGKHSMESRIRECPGCGERVYAAKEVRHLHPGR